jgi:phosphate-selective porin OprO/OprP
VEQLAERLRALEQRLGVPADGEPDAAADVAALDERLRVIERQLELQAEDAAAKAATASTVSLGTKGLTIKSPAAEGVELKLRALVQADGRAWIDDDRLPQNDGFLLRRVRPTIEGTFGPLVGFRLTPEFAGDCASIVDAYVDLKFDPRATLRVGKVKGPVGLERLQSGGSIGFVERGFPTELAPNRDLGVQLLGEVAGGRLQYVGGAYNGAPDGRDAPSTNADGEVEFAGRVFWEPFRDAATGWSGLGIGLAGSHGDRIGGGTNALARYRTPGQVVFFGYRSPVVADGTHARWSPQGYFYRGPFGLLAEYIESGQTLRSGAVVERLGHRAWQVAASWVLTGEDASYRGVARPDSPLASGGGGFGAVEIAARIGALEIDEDAFPLFADPAASARRARARTLGVNWYLTQNLKLVANYTQASFEGGAPNGADREDEKTLFTRAQLSF